MEGEGVTHAEVLEMFAANVTWLRELVEKIIEDLPAGRDCPCPDALDGIKLPFERSHRVQGRGGRSQDTCAAEGGTPADR